MIRFRRTPVLFLSLIALLIAGAVVLVSQSTGRRATALIRQSIDETRLVTLAGNLRSEANAENDLGAVADDLPMDHMMLQLKRSPAQEQAVAQAVADLYNPKSPNFHKWMTAEQFGNNFGLADSDIQTITGWLESHGFTVNSVYPSGMVIDFSGTAGQVRGAFHTSIHNLDVGGVRHIANFSDPQIPQALAPAVAGVVSLHDFKPHKASRRAYTFGSTGDEAYAVVPADLATIYDFNPLLAKGITGKGQTIAVIEDGDLYSPLDWNTFRSALGLSTYTSGSLISANPPAVGGRNNCVDPGVNGADDEVALDAEWASAGAPGATIEVAACDDTLTTFGGFIAMQNMINGSNPPLIMSISYITCEAENGASSNLSINSIYQQAAAEGVSVFVASGDEGAAGCDYGATSASHGIGVNAFASSVYDVAVGGTDFSDSYNGTNRTYWSARNSTTYGSAISYIPEIPWNDSCAGSLLANYFGYSTGYGADGFCNSETARTSGFVTVGGGSGGPSNCATGAPSISGIAGGGCKGYAKPSWQNGIPGIASDGVRDLPDVSMFAADGVWSHFAIFCFSDTGNGGSPCTGAPEYWTGAGGTSFASPVMAGIQALINQNMGSAQGNPSPVLYSMASSTPSAFHPTPMGDMVVNCTGGSPNCYGWTGTVSYGRGGRLAGTTTAGSLSTSTSSYSPAYAASGSTWNFATGLGSVDAYNLVTNWTAGK